MLFPLITKKTFVDSRRGFTLVELLISLTLFAILIAIAIGGFARALRTQQQVGSLLAAESNVSLAIEQMAREIRTGSDFCSGVNAGLCQLSCQPPDPVTGLVSCGSLAFTNVQGQTVIYNLQNNMIQKSTNAGGSYDPITGSNVTIPYLEFTLFGNTTGDHWPPRLTIDLGVASKDSVLASQVLYLQTTVSARAMDCDIGGTC